MGTAEDVITTIVLLPLEKEKKTIVLLVCYPATAATVLSKISISF
jgi:hypothetical protein